MPQNFIVIGTSALLITFRCNLRCKLCCTDTPYMPKEKQVDFPLEKMKDVLKRYFEVIKHIRKLSFGGGEPTLYSNLPELIEYTAGFRNQFEVFEIITNGAVMPSGAILDMAEKHKDIIFFMIDNYGENISRRVREISAVFESRGISFKIRDYHGPEAHAGGWVNLGDYSLKHDAVKAKNMLKDCCISSKKKDNTGVNKGSNGEALEQAEGVFFINYAANTNGLIHRCARAYSTLGAGAVAETPDIFVNIMDEKKTVAQIREEIITLFSSDYYPACEYCNGFDDSSVRYEPAEQIH